MRTITPETTAAQAGGPADETTGGIVPPIHVATTFVRDADNQYRRGYSYGRPDNATVRQVEGVMSRLEGGESSQLLSSGMAAATTSPVVKAVVCVSRRVCGPRGCAMRRVCR